MAGKEGVILGIAFGLVWIGTRWLVDRRRGRRTDWKFLGLVGVFALASGLLGGGGKERAATAVRFAMLVAAGCQATQLRTPPGNRAAPPATRQDPLNIAAQCPRCAARVEWSHFPDGTSAFACSACGAIESRRA